MATPKNLPATHEMMAVVALATANRDVSDGGEKGNDQ
jgi:hypothetical protein